MLLFFVGLVKLGLGGDFAAGIVVTVLAATTAVAVLVTLRALGAEEWARRAAPFLVLTPAAVFMAVSADAVIAAVVAWGLACLALATQQSLVGGAGRAAARDLCADVLRHAADGVGRARGPASPGARGGRCRSRRSRRSPWCCCFAAMGFAWWDAYPVLQERYFAGIASDRPQSYWWYGNLACLAISAGPLLFSGPPRRGCDRRLDGAEVGPGGAAARRGGTVW